MNALEIVERVRAHQADVVVEHGQLVVRGRGERLPDELREALREHKAELLPALGESQDGVIASILADIRPHLPPALRAQPDSSLLVLVNWSILHAWGKTVRELSDAVRH